MSSQKDESHIKGLGREKNLCPNVLGITQFRFHFDVDSSHGGRAIVDPGVGNSDSWVDLGIQTHIAIPFFEGDGVSFRFWVEARDIASHFAKDSVLVHVDASPPVIEDFKIVVGLYGIRLVYIF